MNRFDSQIVIVENQGMYHSVQESVVRIYDVGRRKDYEEDDQEEDDDEDDNDMDGSDDDASDDGGRLSKTIFYFSIALHEYFRRVDSLVFAGSRVRCV